MNENTEFICARCGKEIELVKNERYYQIAITNASPYDNRYRFCDNCYAKFRLFAQGHKLVDDDKIKGINFNHETNKYDTIYK